MKESKFIELLNLYLDQQIAAPDAARLEQEIATDPKRRALYQQYCRMHRACTLLFEQSLPGAPVGAKLSAGVEEADRKLVAFPAATGRGRWVAAAGVLAAAACVALVLVARRPTPAAPSRSAVAAVVAPPAPAAAAPVSEPVPASMFAAAARTSAAAEDQPSLAWMHQVKFTPVAPASLGDLVFDPAAGNDARKFHSRLPVETAGAPKTELMNLNAEKAAWQFTR